MVGSAGQSGRFVDVAVADGFVFHAELGLVLVGGGGFSVLPACLEEHLYWWCFYLISSRHRCKLPSRLYIFKRRCSLLRHRFRRHAPYPLQRDPLIRRQQFLSFFAVRVYLSQHAFSVQVKVLVQLCSFGPIFCLFVILCHSFV